MYLRISKGNQSDRFCSKCYHTYYCIFSNSSAASIPSTGQNNGNSTYDHRAISQTISKIVSPYDYFNHSIWFDAREFSLSESISYNVRVARKKIHFGHRYTKIVSVLTKRISPIQTI